MTYAAGTTVSVERSHAEILKLLTKHGASSYGITSDGSSATIGFCVKGSHVRLRFPLPTHADKVGRAAPWALRRWEPSARDFRPWNPATDGAPPALEARKLEQGTRERWRLIVLTLKTKLELVALGARTIEQEFLDGLVLPNGSTVGQELVKLFEVKPALLALPESGS